MSDEKLKKAADRLDSLGREIVDPNPIAVPTGFQRPETLEEQIQRLVRTRLSEAYDDETETFEEADDFDVGDDVEPFTPYETYFDPILGQELTPKEFDERQEYYRQRYEEAASTFPVEHMPTPRGGNSPSDEGEALPVNVEESNDDSRASEA